MVRITFSSFKNMRPEERKFDLTQPLTLTLTFEPNVLLPMVKPLIVIENGIDELIPTPVTLKITEFEERRLLDTGIDEVAKPAVMKGATDGWKKKRG